MAMKSGNKRWRKEDSDEWQRRHKLTSGDQRWRKEGARVGISYPAILLGIINPTTTHGINLGQWTICPVNFCCQTQD
ncbi:hypothetical protein PanWU01x14_157080 [Parasponia andersonii]|uniref:Uncharacterized protein n=1 Tax=Parasponia andersonii TaxID=3476 RepID=A0A2P5CFI3_PARAD|nr:hypothetical protein PanWU01x14_157080 [Parasponia andersonii]